MPREIQFNNPAFRGVQAQQGTLYVPDEGEFFLFGGSNESIADLNRGQFGDIYYLKNGQIKSISLDQLGYQSSGSFDQSGNLLPGKTSPFQTSGQARIAGIQYLQEKAGFDPSQLKIYNMGDLALAGDKFPEFKTSYQQGSQNMNISKGTLDEFKSLYQNSPQTGGNIGAQTNIQGVGPGAATMDQAIAQGTATNYDVSLGADKIAQLQAQDKAQQALAGTAPTVGGATVSAATATSGSATPAGTIPGYKGVYANQANSNATDVMINNLFKQYHGRDANITELNYWRNKTVGQLEDTLAKTQIFSKEDADRIRAQMAAEGKTYIANQAELEQLAKTGGISATGLTSVSQQGGMLFNPAPVTSGSGLGASGSTTGASGTSSGASNTTGASGTSGSTLGSSGDTIVDMVADAVGDVNASETDILNALNKLKTSQIDPYYKQLISQAQRDVTLQINRNYEDRIRQLQTESFNMAENIKNTQKALEASGMTFSGEAISRLGTLSSFAQGTPAGLTPAQLGQTGQQVMGGQALPTQLGKPAIGLPTMTTEQMGIEGSVNLGNRLMAESSRTGFNRGLEDIGQQALRLLGSTGIQNLGLPAQSTANQPETTGTMQYDYNKTLQSLYGNLANQEGTLTDYQKLFL